MPHTGLLIGGRYRLEARIAAGAVGQVWRATDLVLRRPVAVKLLRSGYTEDPDTLVRFRAEAQLAGSLTHPGIAQVYDYGEDDSPYLVMELVDGPSLAGILDNGPLDPVRTADVIAQAAAGLEAAHRAGLTHRDIKPENLLLGSGKTVKITDFGIAHATGSAPLTGSGVVMGTAAYLAPERAMGAPGTPASDLYSLGIVAYECLTGAVPYDGTRAEIVAGHMQRQLPALPAGVPSGLVNLIAVMTDKNPRVRPATAALVAEHAAKLRDAMAAGRPGDRFGLAPAHLFAQKAPRRRRFVAGAAATAVAAGLGGWLVPGLLTAAPYGARPGAAAATQASSARPSATLATVQVDAGALVGRQVTVVIRRLRVSGLQPLVEWTYGKRPTGIVVQVLPTGPVTRGSTIMVLASYRSAIPPGPTATVSPGTVSHGTAPSPGLGPGRTKNGKPSPSPSGNGSSSSPASSTGTTPPPVAAGTTPPPSNPVSGLLNLPGTILGVLLP